MGEEINGATVPIINEKINTTMIPTTPTINEEINIATMPAIPTTNEEPKLIKTDKQLETEKSERIMQGVARMAGIYRANPHRFCEEYLGIKLKLFQKMLLFLMNINTNFMYIAARG